MEETKRENQKLKAKVKRVALDKPKTGGEAN